MCPDPDGEGLIFALEGRAAESRLALTRGAGGGYRPYPGLIEGRVAALALSPDGDEAVLAVRPRGDRETSELRTFDLRTGEGREITRLEGRQRSSARPVDGAGPLIRGGKQSTTLDDDGSEPLYELYRVPPGAARRTPGVGRDLWPRASGLSRRKRLAVTAASTRSRRPTCKWWTLSRRTSRPYGNEDMEKRPGRTTVCPRQQSVAIVARGTPSTNPRCARACHRLLRDFSTSTRYPCQRTPAVRDVIFGSPAQPGLLHHGGAFLLLANLATAPRRSA